MSSIKRKQSAISKGSLEKSAVKRRRIVAAPKLERQPLGETDTKNSTKKSTKKTLDPHLHTISYSANEQPAFPRGGADLLTPLEKKQIRVQAERDVLRERKRKETRDLFDSKEVDEVSSHEEAGSIDEASNEVKKSHPKKHFKRPRLDKVETDSKPRVEGLNYKSLVAGSLVFGQIARVGRRDISVSLPNNLTGYVPITAISPQFTQTIESLVVEVPEHDKNSAGLDDNGPDMTLSHYFRQGQWIRVAVTSTEEENGQTHVRAKKHIELSLEPKLTNVNLKWRDICVNCTLQASVVSIEDHGIAVDTGLSGDHGRGFIPSSELPPGLKISELRPGTVFLCLVKSLEGGGRIVKLSTRLTDTEGKKGPSYVLSKAPSIMSFMPGTLAEILISDATEFGLVGTIMGMLDVTSDIVQSGARSTSSSLEKVYKPGTKITGRIVNTFPLSDSKKLGFSILEHIVHVETNGKPTSEKSANQTIPRLSSIIKDAKVVKVEPRFGVYFKLDSYSAEGFAPVSRLADTNTDSISSDSGLYRLGTEHQVRVLDYSEVDNLAMLSLQESVLQQQFLRIEDVNLGQAVKAKVEKQVSDENGLKGLVVLLSQGLTGFVPRMHLSDTELQHPEQKFREGSTVKTRVLSISAVKRRVYLTLKKSLVNSDMTPWTTYEQIQEGASSLGTLVKVQSNGAVVQFYGCVKGFLPVAEMSEAYIKDASLHFREGQVLSVNCLHVDPLHSRLSLSCRDPTSVPSEQALKDNCPGTIVSGTVFEKSEDDLLLRLNDSGIIARLRADHICDGSLKRRQAAFKKIRVGQQLSELLVLAVHPQRRLINLCNRASLRTASEEGHFLHKVEDVRHGRKVTGFVSSITSDGIFIAFGDRITGLLPKSKIPIESLQLVDFGYARAQVVTTWISFVDYKLPRPRFWLSLTPQTVHTLDSHDQNEQSRALVDAVDGQTCSIDSFVVGFITKARVVSVKSTQINVELAKNVLGRVDVSEIFGRWEDIKDRKRPLRNVAPKEVLPVRILGAHDARNHRFLPISHRAGKTTVFELSAKPDCIQSDHLELLSLDKVQVGSSWVAFVNKVDEGCLWVNISPNVRGRVRSVDVSDDLSLAANLQKHFPVGSALKARVTSVDIERKHLDLTAKAGGVSRQLTLQGLSEGMILPGRITKISECQILIQLSEDIVGAVHLIDMSDDYSTSNPNVYRKNEVVRACIIDIDQPNKKIQLSLRPSKILSSSLPVEDGEIISIQQLHVNDTTRGFVRNVAEQGLFITLGHKVTAFVRVCNLSDSYIKDWKKDFQRDQLVKGRVISLDPDTGHVQMSLKESVMRPDYVPALAYNDLNIGDFITGKVANVEDFGVFIVVDSSDNVRGLCHRSELAEQRVDDARKLYNEGDVVKAKVLKMNLESRRISFGLKASYFSKQIDEGEDASGSDDEMSAGGVELAAQSDDDTGDLANEDDCPDSKSLISEDSASGNPHVDRSTDSASTDGDAESDAEPTGETSLLAGLQVGGFNWQGLGNSSQSGQISSRTSDAERDAPAKARKRHKASIQADLTGELDAHGPQSASDFERLLLSEPDSSILWLQYMALYLSLGEVSSARHIGHRALQTISPLGQSESEKMNVWIALLNLENSYADKEAVEATFRSACQVNDPQEIHERLASIYIQSSKNDKADVLFQTVIRKFGAKDLKVWINYATFLFDIIKKPERGRGLLSRALQALPESAHVDITVKFAVLEFRSQGNGLPERGRTIFEGLIDSFPKRVDLWNVLLDLEMRYVGPSEQSNNSSSNSENNKNNVPHVRRIFERIFEPISTTSGTKLKNKQAQFFFKRWLEFEEKMGDSRRVGAVKRRAAEWVRDRQAK